MKKLFYLMILFTSGVLYANSDFELLWNYKAPFVTSNLFYSKDYNWALMSNFDSLGIILHSVNGKYSGYDTIPIGSYPYFNEDNLLIGYDFINRIIRTYDPNTKSKQDYVLDFVEPTLSNVMFYSKNYVVYYKYVGAATFVYDVQNRKLENEFSAESGYPVDKFDISPNQEYFLGLYSNNLLKYNLTNHSIEYQTIIGLSGSMVQYIKILNDSLAAIVTINDVIIINTKTGNELSKISSSVTNLFYFDKQNLQIYCNILNKLSNEYFAIINVIDGSIIEKNSTEGKFTENIKIAGTDTLFYSTYKNSDEFGTYLSTYNYTNSKIDTIYKLITMDPVFGKAQPIISKSEIFDDIFSIYTRFYKIEDRELIYIDLADSLEYNYNKYDNKHIFTVPNDSTLRIIDLLTLKQKDSIRISSDEYSSGRFYFTEDKNYLMPPHQEYIRKTSSLEIFYQVPPGDDIAFLDFNNNYFIDNSFINITDNNLSYMKLNVLSLANKDEYFSINTYYQSKTDYPKSALLRDNSLFIYYNCADNSIHFYNIAEQKDETIQTANIVKSMQIDSANKFLAVFSPNTNNESKSQMDIYNIYTKAKLVTIESDDIKFNDIKLNDNFNYLLMDFVNSDFTAYKLNLEFSSVTDNVDNCILSLYPNPTANNLNISSTEIIKNISIYDVNGNCIYKSNDINSESYTQDINSLTAGTYYVKADIGKIKVSRSFVVSR